ncbi:hypothetical protein, partial [Klebsiella pneumoniae]|uniref:hypothetical protein n=1 Tax=Klebsiella pneumoniae TaxID=573 RepID=UPI00273034AD
RIPNAQLHIIDDGHLFLGAVEMLVLRTRLRVLDARRLLLTRLIVFRAWLVVLRPWLVIAWPTTLLPSFMLTAALRARWVITVV